MNTDETESRAALREAMRMQERACASDVPPFACIAAHIEGEPSIFEAPAWSVRKSARLAASLAAAQVRAMPWAVLPMALVMAALAVGVACFVDAGWDGDGAVWWLSALLLLGAALTVTAALSTDAADLLALAMPLGPQTVLLARLAVVLPRRRSLGGARRLSSERSYPRGSCPSPLSRAPRRSSRCGRTRRGQARWLARFSCRSWYR